MTSEGTKFLMEDQIGYVELVDYMGSNVTTVNAARGSFDRQVDEMRPQDLKLLSWMAEHDPVHWSPFTHSVLQFRFNAPIFIARQLWKSHVGLSSAEMQPQAWNELSRRYVSTEPNIFVPQVWNSAPENAKSGSGGPVDVETNKWASKIASGVMRSAVDVYMRLIRDGIAPEQARAVLPQGTYTTWWWTGSLYGFFRIFDLRHRGDAQSEVRPYAQAVDALVPDALRETWEALKR